LTPPCHPHIRTWLSKQIKGYRTLLREKPILLIEEGKNSQESHPHQLIALKRYLYGPRQDTPPEGARWAPRARSRSNEFKEVA
jgi:hypothetical protein